MALSLVEKEPYEKLYKAWCANKKGNWAPQLVKNLENKGIEVNAAKLHNISRGYVQDMPLMKEMLAFFGVKWEDVLEEESKPVLEVRGGKVKLRKSTQH